MDSGGHRRGIEDVKRRICERAEQQRTDWTAGRLRVGGEGPFAGINDPVLRESYLNAAGDLLERNRDRLPQFGLPIFFLQRHALELALKDSISAAALFRHVTERRPGQPPGAGRTHDLGRLLRDLAELLRADESSAHVLVKLGGLVERFHEQDERGTWARYRDDHARAEVDLGSAQRELVQVFEILFAYPRDPDGTYGLVTEMECVTHELLVREDLDAGAS